MDLNNILSDIKNNGIYLKDKDVDLNCLKQKYGFRLSTTKLFHINDTQREKYVSKNYVSQIQLDTDKVLNYGFQILNDKTYIK